MENLLGLLRINVLRGINLAKRDATSSDPYVIVRMGKQKLKTRVVKKNVNPEWNEELTLSIADPSLPVKLVSLIFLYALSGLNIFAEVALKDTQIDVVLANYFVKTSDYKQYDLSS
ncbi:UNVERIFIED_CONTAM: protein C2-DOMAIN ABA-RELATED 2 [Sesamum angustifolium]|uniref:Protein C2-DOMAIN ABA-RELATED 2 n=1 Tax=Sesamum angustifolium TaxID=2727405 RepID=A0AAW2RN07_9LAMI